MGITKKILNWCDGTMQDAYMEENTGKAMGKAFLSGAVEGFVDAAVICYIPAVILGHYWMKKAQNK